MSEATSMFDCAIIGAGPAGLTAALYLARFHRSVVVFDGGRSRAQWIPESHNCPGFPGGVSGDSLLKKLRAQLADYDATIIQRRVHSLEEQSGHFVLGDDAGTRYPAHKVLLASGIVDAVPAVDWIDDAIGVGALRLCPICDGFEVSDKRIAVYGPGSSALEHAIFLRTYTSDVMLICSDSQPLDADRRRRASASGIRVVDAAGELRFDGRACSFESADGRVETFDSVYVFLGCRAGSQLAEHIGAASDEHGALAVDRDQMTTVSGLYAAGDVVSSLHQISVAVGHSGIAATAIHRALDANPRATRVQATRWPRAARAARSALGAALPATIDHADDESLA